MLNPDQPKRTPLPSQARPAFTHTLAALTVLVILIVAAVIADQQAVLVENRSVHGVASLLLEQEYIGSVIQQSAFRQPDLLPVYGSSELVVTNTPYRAFTFFSTYPTGFNVFEVAKGGDTNINMAQDLASLGPILRGKKVVISFTPTAFTQPAASQESYAGNFSLLHASGLIFSPYLSMDIKKRAAGRMAAYPATLVKSPLLQFAIDNLTQNTWANDGLYYALFPFGQLDNFLFKLKDHYAIWQIISSKRNLPMKRQAQTINWQAAISSVRAAQKLRTNNNQFGVDNNAWMRNGWGGVVQFRPAGSQDQSYINRLNNSKEWDDFRIVLDILKQMGAKPLILSRPINGPMYTAGGISKEAQSVYYNKLKALVDSYHYPLVDFQQYTSDPYFSIDYPSHTSPVGWVLVDQVLDAFYHDQLH